MEVPASKCEVYTVALRDRTGLTDFRTEWKCDGLRSGVVDQMFQAQKCHANLLGSISYGGIYYICSFEAENHSLKPDHGGWHGYGAECYASRQCLGARAT